MFQLKKRQNTGVQKFSVLHCSNMILLHCVQKKNTHSHFLSYLHA